MSNLISRADALEAIKLLPVQLDAETVQRCIEAVSNLPSAQITSDVRHGKWLCSDDIYETAVCSVCNFDTGEPYEFVKKSWNFCPNCGAKMDAERKEE